jgi:hypothetical protein
MSLNRKEQDDTRRELRENLDLAGLTPPEIARALRVSPERVESALGVHGASPVDVWLVRDYLDVTVRSRGRDPFPFSLLTEESRSAAQGWFPLLDVSDVVKAGTR